MVTEQEKRAWLERHTFRCEALHANITADECRSISSRPESAGWVTGGHQEARPPQCNKCENRWEGARQEAKVSKRKCKVCGREMTIARAGMCGSCQNYERLGKLAVLGGVWTWVDGQPASYWSAMGLPVATGGEAEPEDEQHEKDTVDSASALYSHLACNVVPPGFESYDPSTMYEDPLLSRCARPASRARIACI